MVNQLTRYTEFLLPHPNASHQARFNPEGAPVNRMRVDSFLAKGLRPHQRDGVVFLFECLMGMRGARPGQLWGALLADEMGLGKTLQCITIVWTLLRQRMYGTDYNSTSGEIQKVLILAPRMLCEAWEKDFNAWLGRARISVCRVNGNFSLHDAVQQNAEVVIVSYEKYARNFEAVNSLQAWDLLICDEAHLLKNPSTRKSRGLRSLDCRRRILLTGSPCQNNLLEFYQLLELTNPGCMGTKEEFATKFSIPITRANEENCSAAERRKGEKSLAKLREKTSQFLLRRTAELNIPYLPGKQDLVVMCSAAELQREMYKEAVRYWAHLSCDPESPGSAATLRAITSLRQISSHPGLLNSNQDHAEEELQEYLSARMRHRCDIDLERHSGKLQVVRIILERIIERSKLKERDRVLIISHFTQTLDLLAALCKSLSCAFCRLDGFTPQVERERIIQEFNHPHSENLAFLLGAQSGSAGLNVTGASRLILFDPDWNPANDAQALSRVWRGKQDRPVITYRLLTAGTIEERMFQRQIKKATLDPTLPPDHPHPKFSSQELQDLFSYHEGENLTHTMLGCECEGRGTNLTEPVAVQCVMPGIEELMHWQHLGPYIEPAILQDMELLHAAGQVTFVFRTEVHGEIAPET